MNNYSFEYLNKKILLLIAATSTLFLVRCTPESEFEKLQQASDIRIETYLSENGINAIQSDHGLYYEMLTKNQTGQIPKVGEVLAIKYEIKTLDGKLLESKNEDSTLLRFGWNYILPNGLNYGFDTIKKGEKIRLYLPSYLAYHAYGNADQFVPNTNFIVDLELVDISTEAQIYARQLDQIRDHITANISKEITSTDSGLFFQSLEPGDGAEAATNHTAKIHYKRTYLDGTLIQQTEEDKPLTVRLDTDQLVKGFKEGVLKMREGEKALLIMPADIGFGASVKVIPGTIRQELWEEGYIGSLVDSYKIVVYEVELIELN
ncbi:FKBP-type peptidyl-prolyl cis-trans isomerase [Reichenbachiella sp.]|uniref:FKBP-type peptidyl-prolyl cis-trans isomerase n=1 Tax=Reichenbachiella sp. TaxID=2184521 RepID=UPI0032984749